MRILQSLVTWIDVEEKHYEEGGKGQPFIVRCCPKRVENFAEYDIIFIGYPNWWYTAALSDSTIESSAVGVYRNDIPKSCDCGEQWLNEIGF